MDKEVTDFISAVRQIRQINIDNQRQMMKLEMKLCQIEKDHWAANQDADLLFPDSVNNLHRHHDEIDIEISNDEDDNKYWRRRYLGR